MCINGLWVEFQQEESILLFYGGLVWRFEGVNLEVWRFRGVEVWRCGGLKV